MKHEKDVVKKNLASNITQLQMKTMYITEGELHAQINLTDDQYNELQRLIGLEKEPVTEDKMPKLILQAVKNLDNQSTLTENKNQQQIT